MTHYQAPVKEMMFALQRLANLEDIARLPGCGEVTPDLVEAVLGEAAQFATEVLAPTNRVGDLEGTRVVDGGVRVPAAFIDAYRQFRAGGWPGLSLAAEHGGQGLPYVLGVATEEIWQAANLAWSLGPLLTQARRARSKNMAAKHCVHAISRGW